MLCARKNIRAYMLTSYMYTHINHTHITQKSPSHVHTHGHIHIHIHRHRHRHRHRHTHTQYTNVRHIHSRLNTHACTCTYTQKHIRTHTLTGDDGNTLDGDGCSSSCTIELGWGCHSTAVNPSTCAAAPSICATTCGDGIVAGPEECDAPGESGCIPGKCVLECGWTCSDGSCQTECGDGVTAGTEEYVLLRSLLHVPSRVWALYFLTLLHGASHMTHTAHAPAAGAMTATWTHTTAAMNASGSPAGSARMCLFRTMLPDVGAQSVGTSAGTQYYWSRSSTLKASVMTVTLWTEMVVAMSAQWSVGFDAFCRKLTGPLYACPSAGMVCWFTERSVTTGMTDLVSLVIVWYMLAVCAGHTIFHEQYR
jgi:hypothetical protein